MARITITGDAVVVTSALSLDSIRTIEKYRPKSLVLMGGDDGKEQIFKLGTTTGTGSINQYGASFAGESHDDAKSATITMLAEGAPDDIKSWAAEKIGVSIINLNKLEALLPAVLDEIVAEKFAVMENITVV